MILVDGVPFSTHLSSTSQGIDTLLALLENPFIVSASNSFKTTPQRKFSVSEESCSDRSKWVYVFQSEYATVDPAFVNYVGTDEATTCVGLVIRNRSNGMTSLAHMDSPEIVDTGLSQMLSLLVDDNMETGFEVHLIGGFEDVSPKHANGRTESESHSDLEGYSFPLCTKIVQALCTREETFHLQTLCVLGHNTRRDSDGNTFPIFNGFAVETMTGRVIPASFDRTSRCPDEIVRRIRVTASFEDPSRNGKLLETYDTKTDRFIIAPCRWTLRQYHIASTLIHHSDSEILSMCSTSPDAEGPDFVDSLRRKWNYLIEHPSWTETFPRKQPRIFERTADGSWRRC
ncbi:protein N-terminal asparagine amidohydrolase [Neltuma alba]|uniref:protein N-terminal asparagine amidohydrolase n=1 Tax=Neltuma alba TaxID=207710 RepID=UPI0010A487BA|nr:protein N-terminal asparagine amidohydrolase [Prosopis alba]